MGLTTKSWLLLGGALILVFVLTQFLPQTSFLTGFVTAQDNPLEYYCLQQGGELWQSKAPDGDLDTYCTFTTGASCTLEELYAGTCSSLDLGIVFCTDEQRLIDVCHKVENHVCATTFRGKESTFINSCFACLDKEVDFWKEGAC